jgi:hypothetical protein
MEVRVCFSGEDGHHGTREPSRAVTESFSVAVSSGSEGTVLHQVLYVQVIIIQGG